MRRFAAQALGDIEADPKVAAAPLAPQRADPKEQVSELQQAAAVSLGKMGLAGVAPLVTAIKDDSTDNDVRRKAIESVGKIGPDAKAAIPALVGQLKMTGGTKKNPNQDGDFRIEAATSLGQIATADDKEALAALRDLAGGKDLKKNKSLGDALKTAIKEIEMRNNWMGDRSRRPAHLLCRPGCLHYEKQINQSASPCPPASNDRRRSPPPGSRPESASTAEFADRQSRNPATSAPGARCSDSRTRGT